MVKLSTFFFILHLLPVTLSSNGDLKHLNLSELELLKLLTKECSVCLAVEDTHRMVMNHKDGENLTVTSTEFPFTVIMHRNYKTLYCTRQNTFCVMFSRSTVTQHFQTLLR
jgi:hypothetical protein